MYCVQWKNGWMQCLQAQLMLETAHVVCNSIVEYTEQAGVWRKILRRLNHYFMQKVPSSNA